jgi:prepilin-type N-terminal cleavage/methylation domain-containing protein
MGIRSLVRHARKPAQVQPTLDIGPETATSRTHAVISPGQSKTVNDERYSTVGFTIIELLIAIVLLGVLASIVMLNIRGVSGKAPKHSCQIDFRLMAGAIESFYALNGTYPMADNPLTLAANEAVDDLANVRVMDVVSRRWKYSGGAPSALVPVAPCSAADVS